MYRSGVAQWKRAGPITLRSKDRNLPPLISFFLFSLDKGGYLIRQIWAPQGLILCSALYYASLFYSRRLKEAYSGSSLLLPPQLLPMGRIVEKSQ